MPLIINFTPNFFQFLVFRCCRWITERNSFSFFFLCLANTRIYNYNRRVLKESCIGSERKIFLPMPPIVYLIFLLLNYFKCLLSLCKKNITLNLLRISFDFLYRVTRSTWKWSKEFLPEKISFFFLCALLILLFSMRYFFIYDECRREEGCKNVCVTNFMQRKARMRWMARFNCEIFHFSLQWMDFFCSLCLKERKSFVPTDKCEKFAETL